MGYKYYQPNKKDIKDEVGDCVIRSYTKVTGEDWVTVFDDLVDIARELQCMPNSDKCTEEYNKQKGIVKGEPIRIKAGKARMTLAEFAKKMPKDKKYVVHLANHVVGVSDGNYYDTWDSGYKAVYKYYEVKEGKEYPYVLGKYNKEYGDDRVCKCGHTYDRHFDLIESDRAGFCKYCGCGEFVEE